MLNLPRLERVPKLTESGEGFFFIWWNEFSEIDIYFIRINFHLVLISIVFGYDT